MAKDVTSLNDAEPEADYRSANDTPGALRGETWITIQTRQAQRLVIGRRANGDKQAIIGLTRFGSMVAKIGWRARWDDPHADWWLIRIEEIMDGAESELASLQQSIDSKLDANPGLEVKIAESLSPVRIPLKFSDTYAYRAAKLVSDYDKLVRAILTARQVGYLTRDESERALNLGGKAVRRTLSAAVGFHNQGTTRKDMREGNARAAQAQSDMGTVPADILAGERRARHAPPLLSDMPKTKPLGFFGSSQRSSFFSKEGSRRKEASDDSETHDET